MKQSNLGAYFNLALAQTMVGLSIVGSKYLVNHIDFFQLLVLRFSIGTLFIYIIAKIMNPRSSMQFKKLTKVDWFFLAMQALSAGFFFNIFLLLGLKFTSATLAGVLTSTLPAIIFVFSFIFLKEQLTRAKLECIGLALIGLFLINYKNLMAHHDANSHYFLGNAIIMLALVPEAAFYILVKIHRCPLPSAISGTWIMLINALSFLPFALWHAKPSQLLHMSHFDAGLILILSAASALFYLCWSLGAKKIEASVASLFTAVMPISALMIARIFLGEQLSWLQILGMGFIISSIFVSTGAIKKYFRRNDPHPFNG